VSCLSEAADNRRLRQNASVTDEPVPPSSARRPTLADIAERAGVSSAAVSQALNATPGARISPEMREKIGRIAVELGYRPNMTARALRTARSGAIGLISDRVTTTRFASGLLTGVLEEGRTGGQFVLIAETDGQPDRLRDAVAALLDRGVDGIVFAAMKSQVVDVPPLPPGLPAVALNLIVPGLPAVLPDEAGGAVTALALLADEGRLDDVALVGADSRRRDDPSLSEMARRRVGHLVAGMSERGLAFSSSIACNDWEPEQGYRATRELLRQGEPPATILCLNDRLAVGAFRAIAEAGWLVPSDIAVLSYDDDEITALLQPPLTTIAIPHEEMGRLAVRILADVASAPAETRVSMPLLRRQSL
jgi:LacI family transcriptional regulator